MAGRGLGGSYRRLWTASAVSTLGDGMYLAALPLLAATLTRDPLAVSVVTFAGWLPWLLFALPAGALVDRLDRRRVMWTVDAARAVVVGALTAAVLAGWASIPLLAAAGFLVGAGQTLFENAAQAMVVAVVGRDPRRLERANGQLVASLTVGQQLAGPPLGSAAFAMATWVPFLADAVSFGASASLVAAIKGRFRVEDAPAPRGPAPHLPAELPARRSLWAEIGEGLRFLVGHRLLRAAVLLVSASNLAFMAGEAVLVLFATEELGLGSRGYGLLLAAVAVGGLPGSLLAARVGGRVPPGRLIVGGVLAGAVVMAGFGLATDPWLAAAAYAATGAVWGVWNVTLLSLRQAIVPDRLMGRVVGAIRLVGFGSIPIGALLGGVAARTLGLRAPFLLGAAVLAVAALAAAPVVTTPAIEAARSEAGAGPWRPG
ncbi:MAG TPA: MFS transporter [Actinomycetota bacterium]|nr:MFS transporter [Actinomycetota bacterium]